MSNPNVALVVLDTLRKDTFDRHFEWLEGTSYDNAWSTTHNSPAAHGSLFTGRFASEIGVHGKSPALDCPEPTLAELLCDSGYTTRGFSANTYVSKYFVFDRGFDEFRNETRVVGGEDSAFNWPKFIKEHKTDGPRRYADLLAGIWESDAPLFPTLGQGAKIKLKDLGVLDADRSYEDGKKAIDYVESTEFESQGEFLLINLMDVHGPYKAPAEYRTVDPVHVTSTELTIGDETDVCQEEVVAAYNDCARYLSDVYVRLHDVLTDDFEYVITTSDHGEAFGEHGVWCHMGLVPEVTNVPLSIWTPPEADRIEPTGEPVNLHDLFQTVCDLAGTTPPDNTRGESLTNASGFRDRYKLLETHGLSTEKKERLLDDGFDPGTLAPYDQPLHAVASSTGYAFETFEGPIEHVGERIPDAEEKMTALVNDLDRRNGTTETDVPEHVRRRLKELGYA